MTIDWRQLLDIVLPLLIATGLGGILGLEREIRGQFAGLRTHMMVSMGSAMFVLAGASLGAAANSDIGRVIQGVATGVGFIGAGTIVKLSDRIEVKGVTTASSIWLASAAGVAAGLKLYLLAAAGTFISLGVLAALRPLEKPLAKIDKHKD